MTAEVILGETMRHPLRWLWSVAAASVVLIVLVTDGVIALVRGVGEDATQVAMELPQLIEPSDRVEPLPEEGPVGEGALVYACRRNCGAMLVLADGRQFVLAGGRRRVVALGFALSPDGRWLTIPDQGDMVAQELTGDQVYRVDAVPGRVWMPGCGRRTRGERASMLEVDVLRRGAVSLGAVMLVVLVGGCSQGSPGGEAAGPVSVTTAPASVAEPTSSDVEPPRQPPEDLCDLVDYSSASVVFGEPIPSSFGRTTISEEDTLRCVESYFGLEDPEVGRLPGGAATVHISILDSEAAAVDAFDGVAIYATVPPFPGGEELSADQLQFRQSSEAVHVELRVENLFVEVTLRVDPARFDDLGPVASEAPAATAAIASSVLEALSETE